MRDYDTCLTAGHRCRQPLECWQIELAACIDTSMKTKRGLQPFEYPSVRYWSKEINGTLTGGRKN